jgi:hypothetical protein
LIASIFTNRNRVPILYFVLASLVALSLGIVGGSAQAQNPDPYIRYPFADGVIPFCENGGSIATTYYDVFSYDGGFPTPEAAAHQFVKDLRFALFGGHLPDGQVLPQEMRELLGPAENLQITSRKDINENLVYLDSPSKTPEVLNARLVVERLEGQYYVTGSFVCTNSLISDPVKWGQLLTEKVRKNGNR